MSWRWWLHRILAFYPTAWRKRYGREAAVVIDDLLADGRARPARLAANLVAAAIRERARALFTHQSPRIPGGWLWPPRRLRLYRDRLGRTGLDPSSESLFEPGEEVIATFGAVTSHPSLRSSTSNMAIFAAMLTGLALYFSRHGAPVSTEVLDLEAAALDVLVLAACAFLRVTRSRRVMFAATTTGLVQCRRDWLGRPRQVINRQPAVAPSLIKTTRAGRKVRLGETVVWVSPKTDRLMGWMAAVG